ncbi:hypothetical protein [Sphingomonas humi]|uniref:DUF4440 domain-containing protein n=1 Tax=Sphingomonas humi TaxID=335630 RepID=A0ABP7RGH7_9SPHN
MILASLLLATTAPASAIDAERAFAADAQKIGQWTAFRKWADPTAVMFDPQAVWALEFLKDRKDPPRSVEWWPAKSFVSCDGRTAVNTGPWRIEAAKADGYFTTLWMKQPSGEWRWTVDGGDSVATPLAKPAKPVVRAAACGNRALRARQIARIYANPINRTAPPGDSGYQRSADGTLLYNWTVASDGMRRTRVQLWTGRGFATVLDQKVAAPRPRQAT